jgi:acylphosphatase
MPSEISPRRIVYSGRVQGVGFRYTSRRIARQYAISGFVRNLPDGTVELVVAGAGDEQNRFLEALSEALSGNIVTADETALTGEVVGGGFEIRY